MTFKMTSVLVPAVLLCCPVPVAAQSTPAERPGSVDQLDCARLDIDLASVGPDLIKPGIVDPRKAFGEAMAGHPEMRERFAKAQALDPNGLCHYRDANKRLPPRGASRVVFMGDSITEIWGKATPGLFGPSVINRGIAGQNTAQMLARFRHDVVDLKPTVVHIMGGINDINTPSGTTLTLSNIQSMVDIARANGIRVILGSITPSSHFWMFPDLAPSATITALNRRLKAYAQANNIAYVDYYSVLTDAKGGLRTPLSNDALHPNANGFALMTPLAKAAMARATGSAAVRRR